MESYVRNVMRVLAGETNLPKNGQLIKEIYKNIDKKNLTPNEWLSWFHLLKNVLAIVLCSIAINFMLGHYFLYVFFPFLIIFEAICFYGIFSVMHDCTHGSFSKYRHLNTLLGVIIAPFLGNHYFAFRHSHIDHHIHSQNVGKDPKSKFFTTSKKPRNPDTKTKKIFQKQLDFHNKLFHLLHLKIFQVFFTMVYMSLVYVLRSQSELGFGLAEIIKKRTEYLTKSHTFFLLFYPFYLSALYS